jgi:hypothetical protein
VFLESEHARGAMSRKQSKNKASSSDLGYEKADKNDATKKLVKEILKTSKTSYENKLEQTVEAVQSIRSDFVDNTLRPSLNSIQEEFTSLEKMLREERFLLDEIEKLNDQSADQDTAASVESKIRALPSSESLKQSLSALEKQFKKEVTLLLS